MDKAWIGCVERADGSPIPELFKHDTIVRRRNGVEWLAAKSNLGAGRANRFEHWIADNTGRRRLASIEALEQFQRLGISLGREEHRHPLRVLENVRFDGSAVAGDVVDELCDELERGLKFIACLETQSWELRFDGYREARLVLSPDGARLCQWRGGCLRVFPDGVRLVDAGMVSDVGRIEEGVVYSPAGTIVHTGSSARNALRRFVRCFTVEARSPEAPFSEFVNTLIQVCREARSGVGIVLFREQAPAAREWV